MHKGDPTCSELGIPSHLHRNGRGIDPHFEQEEHYYRRFQRLPRTEVIDKDGRIPFTIITTRDMSGNREKYCKSPEDVLYNINSAEHFFSRGIWKVQVSSIDGMIFNQPENARAYTIRVFHDPEDCMYPHAIVQVLENGKPITAIKSKSVKTKIRKEIARHTRVIKKPDQS